MRFEEGQVIEVRGRKYEITGMHIVARDDRSLQYYLEPINHDIPARLKPHTDGMTLIEYHDVSDGIEVKDR